MRVAGNKLKHLVDFYHSELTPIYETGEIEALLGITVNHVLGFSKTEILQKKEENINQSDLLKLYDYCKELKKHIPLQYLLGETLFYNLKFKVNEQVLIPRPETEELMELILKEASAPKSILDIGTGSGCIPVVLKKNLPKASVFACDISASALEVANKNAVLNHTEVLFFEANVLLPGKIEEKSKTTFDIIVSNPPYIKISEKMQMEKQVLEHEPHLALFVEDADEIIFYKKIIDLCDTCLNAKGMLYFELNPLTAEAVKAYALTSQLFSGVDVMMDMSGVKRFMKAQKK